MLSIKNLRLKYPDDNKIIFKNLDITIKDKEKVLILGPSGSGKSTLLNVLSGIIPRSIDVPMKVDELQIDAFPGVIFQDPDTQFCMPEIKEELAFVLENMEVESAKMDDLIQNAMDSVGLNADPSMKINRLSGGMKQKLAIASILLQQAETIFLDEPTAMLDKHSTTQLWDLLKQKWDNQTVVIVEHKVDYIWDFIDRVIVMDDQGNIVHDCTPQEMLNQHTDILNTYGVWHPKSWDYAPSFKVPKLEHTPLLQLTNLEVMRSNKTLYNVSNLNISSGEWITLSGPNGSGKTTLFETLMQLIKYRGDIYFNDVKIKKIKQASENMYFVYQNPELQFIETSVYNEIYINYLSQNKETAHNLTLDMLQLLKLLHVKDQHPFELSIGQKKRLSVATALSTHSEIILLDEPTFGLDSHNTFELLKLFQNRIKAGQTIIMITHEDKIINHYATKNLSIFKNKLHVHGGVSYAQ